MLRFPAAAAALSSVEVKADGGLDEGCSVRPKCERVSSDRVTRRRRGALLRLGCDLESKDVDAAQSASEMRWSWWGVGGGGAPNQYGCALWTRLGAEAASPVCPRLSRWTSRLSPRDCWDGVSAWA